MSEITRTETFMFDANGEPVDVGDPMALHGESVHYDADGAVVRRDYLRAGPAPTRDDDPVDDAIEAEPGPWNLTLDGEPVTTLDQLLAWTGSTNTGDPRNLDRVAAVMLLASWPNAPESLKDEVHTYLGG